MLTRRKVAIATLAAPYFFMVRTVKADPLTDGLVANVTRVADNLSLRPAGQVGRDVPVAGGGTVFGRSTTAQANMMANAGNFTETAAFNAHTSNVCANRTGYTFARFQRNYRNFCCPMGVMSNQDISRGYSGAMTLLEGPNFVGLRVLTDLLAEKGYSADQLFDYVWPLSPSASDVISRQRALITYQSITSENTSSGPVYADRDVLHARTGLCVLRYTHTSGVPDGGGEGAIVVNGRQEFRFEFKYDKAILQT